MYRRDLAVVFSLAVILLIIVSLILLKKDNSGMSLSTAARDAGVIPAGEKGAASRIDESSASFNNTASVEGKDTKAEEIHVVRSEEIAVANNLLEYDLKASIYMDSVNKSFLKLEYYLDGESRVKELDEESIPEIRDIFINGTGGQLQNPGDRILKVILNSRLSKCYIIVPGKVVNDAADISVYSYNLKEGTAKKIFENHAIKLSDVVITKDSRYLAFSYLKEDSPDKAYLMVYICDGDVILVNGNIDPSGNPIAKNIEKGYRHYYDLSSWYTNTSLLLKETLYKDGNGSTGSVDAIKREVVYDIEENLMTNADGSLINPQGTDKSKTATEVTDKAEAPAEQKSTESEALKALRRFYGFLSSEQYDKAYDMLDDRFRINAFKLLGADELSKKDIDVESFSVYGSIFRTVRIEKITGEKSDGGSTVIYFYQLFSMNEGDNIRQPLAALMKNTEKGWKVAELNDWNGSQQ